MKKTNNLDNKGFSLVELIIVIAIMAILTAVIGSQVIPYMEKSRVSKDKSTLDAVFTSWQSVIADYAVQSTEGVAVQFPASAGTDTIMNAFSTANGNCSAGADSALIELVGFASSDLANKWNSKSATQGSGGAFTGGSSVTAKDCSIFFDGNTKEIAVGVGTIIISNKK